MKVLQEPILGEMYSSNNEKQVNFISLLSIVVFTHYSNLFYFVPDMRHHVTLLK